MIDDQIRAAVEDRAKLLAFSRDTGIPKHGDLTQMDRNVEAMCETAHLSKLAAWRRTTPPDRGGRDR